MLNTVLKRKYNLKHFEGMYLFCQDVGTVNTFSKALKKPVAYILNPYFFDINVVKLDLKKLGLRVKFPRVMPEYDKRR